MEKRMKHGSRSRRINLATKFIFLTSALIVSTAAIIAFFVVRNEIQRTYQDLLNHGRSLAVIIAHNSEYGIYAEDKRSLQQMVESIENDPNIAYLFILNGKKEILVRKTSHDSLLKVPLLLAFQDPETHHGISSREFVNKEDGQEYIDLLTRVESERREDPFELMLSKSTDTPQVIGYVHLGLSKKGLHKGIRHLLLTVVLFTLFLVLSGILLTVFMVKRIIAPIKKLREATQDIAEGKFDSLIKINTNDEISDLAGTFNHMLDRLRGYRSEVEKRTEELTETNRLITEEISVRERTEKELISTKARLENLLSSSTAVIYSCEPTSDYAPTFVSENVTKLLGYEPHEFIKTPQFWKVHIHKDDAPGVFLELRKLSRMSHHILEYRFRHKDGSYRWLRDEVQVVCDREDKPVEIIGHLVDISESKSLEEKLTHDALHDPLTGLPNRTLFRDRLEMMFARAQRNKAYSFAVLFLDLDNFKKVNDSLGHVIGDQLLAAVAMRLKSIMRTTNTFARLGGDEFAILLDDVTGMSGILSFAEKVQNEIKLPFRISAHNVYTSASVGIVVSNAGYARAEDMVRDADTAMYHAKTLGRGRHVTFDKSMYVRAQEALHLETELRRAMEQKEFVVHYLPVVSLETGKVTELEALLRWKSPDGDFIPPGKFIPLAEETGMIIPIGNWVLKEACRQMRVWQERSLSNAPLTVSINLSPKQFTPALIDQIEAVLYDTGLNPESLRIEITESLIMQNEQLAVSVLSRLKELNIRVYIDDFGTGYSSLSYLHAFPIHTLKIDRSFIKTMCVNADALEIIRSIVNLGHSLSMLVIAEGVETEEQLELLKELHCDFFQGFIFSAALDPAGVGKILSDTSPLVT
jgi:diguanylate cyclase (GGDEF)-like protein/PAS domain S-box-containing protein